MGEFEKFEAAPEGHNSAPDGRLLEDLSFEELEQVRAALEAEEAELMGVGEVFTQENYRELRALSEKIAQIDLEITNRVFENT